MTCKECTERIDAHLDDALDAQQAQEMKEHAQGCAQCRTALNNAQSINGALKKLNDQATPQDLHANMMQAVREAHAQEKRPRARRGWQMVLGGGLAAALLIVAFVGGSIAGPTAAMGDGAAQPLAMAAMVQERGDTAQVGGGMYAEQEDMAMGAMPPQAEMGRNMPDEGASEQAYGDQLIRTGYLTLESRSFEQDVAAVQDLTRQAGGYEENSNYTGVPYGAQEGYGRWATLTLRVPAQQLDAFMAQARTLGNATDFGINSTDITAQYSDNDMRIQSLRTQQKRLNELLLQAESMEDILAIESKLSDVQLQIEQMEGVKRDWDSRVSYAQVTLHMQEVQGYSDKSETPLGGRIAEAFSQGLRGFAQGIQNLVVWLAGNVAQTLLLALAAVAAVLLARQLWRRRRQGQ